MTGTLSGHAGIRAALNGHDPSKEQECAIRAPLGPIAVIAGAGSGKTAVMAARLVWLVEKGFEPDTLLGLTFTHKACGELQQRVRQALAAIGVTDEPTVLTYHGFADALVAASATRLGLRGGRLVSEAHRWQILLCAADRVHFEHLAVRSPDTLGDALTLASRLADQLVAPGQLAEWERGFRAKDRGRALAKPVLTASLEREELAALVAAFLDEKRKMGLVDFDDQIRLAVELAGDPEVRDEVRSRWSAVLLDEYQDTNVAQVELVRRLWGDGSFPLTAVGDPQQAIYGFRGATLDNVVSFSDHFSAEEPLPLPMSFRCDGLILEAANAVADGLPREQRGVALKPRPGAGRGSLEMFWASDHEAESLEIARRVEVLGTSYCYGEMAILVRSRNPLFPSLRVALEDRGIPVEVVGLGGLIDMPEVVEVISTLQVLHDPGTDRHLARWLLGPALRVSPGDVAALTRWNRSATLLDAARAAALGQVSDVSPEASVRCGELVESYDGLARLVGRPLPTLVEAVLDLRGIRREVEAARGQRAAAARRHIASFLDNVARFAPFEGDASLGAFLAYLEAVRRQPDEMETVLPSSDDAVKLLTIHQAKGLEFDVVFLPMLAATRMPASWAKESWADHRSQLPTPLRADGRFLPDFDEFKEVFAAFDRRVAAHTVDEERRVFYVGLTRARHHVVASGAWFYGDNFRPTDKSVFYEDVARIPGVVEEAAAERPESNPVLARTLAQLGGWPGPGRAEVVDDLFPQGLSAALPQVPSLVAALPPGDRSVAGAEAERLASEDVGAPAAREPAPDVVSVSALESLARCPRRFYWEHVRPLPRPRTRAATVGTIVHEEIERRALGRGPVEPPDPPGGSAVEAHPSSVRDALAAFETSRFAGLTPSAVEVPFVLERNGRVVRGRIDALYSDEIVDWKTGPALPDDDPARGLQLDLYGLAAVEAFGLDPDRVTLTLVHLGHDVELTRPLERDEAAARLDLLLERLALEDWAATPGSWCARCDFRDVCPWRAASD